MSDWIVAAANPADARTLSHVRLFGILGTWMEADIVAATIRNAITQGCERVYLVDNGSPDETVAIAVAEGAILSRSFATERYDERQRLRHMNDVVADVSESEPDQYIWWHFLDADEFAHGPWGTTLLDYLKTLDERFRVVGTRYFNHYPSHRPYYIPGRHPLDFQPLCEELAYPMCPSGHRKHPLQRYDKGGARIECGRGFHLAHCAELLYEPSQPAFLHHFPFRDEAVTRGRLGLLWAKDATGAARAIQPDDATDHMLTRFRSLDAVYAQNWSQVENFIASPPVPGVRLKPWTEMVEEPHRQVLRWGSMLRVWNDESLPTFQGIEPVPDIDGQSSEVVNSSPAQDTSRAALASGSWTGSGDRPLVSAVIIFLDALPFLQEAIASVLAQTYAHWELLLVDDGSTDGSTAVARGHAARDPSRVRYLEHPGHENRGMSASRNLGLSHARGTYIGFLDGDDVWLEHKLERQVAIFEARPEVDMVYGNTLFWYSWTGAVEDRSRDCLRGIGLPADTLVSPPGLITRCYPLGDAPSPATCSILARRTAIDRVGGFETAFRGMFEDQAFLAKAYLTATIFVSGETWDKYRLRPDSCVSIATKTGQDRQLALSFLNWLEAYLQKKGVEDAAVWQALRRAVWPYRHRLLHALSKRVAGLAGETAQKMWALNNMLTRVISRKPTGTITASPNPIQVSDRFSLGATTLSWEVTGTTAVEVRVDAADGPLLCRGESIGSAPTGVWVTDGMVFYLQDASDGLPRAAANTLAATRVRVVGRQSTT